MEDKEVTFTYKGHGGDRKVKLSEIEKVLNPEEFYVLNIEQRDGSNPLYIRDNKAKLEDIKKFLSVNSSLLENAAVSVSVADGGSIWQ